MFRGYIPAWRKAPFLRCLVPLITGIIIQWHFQIPLKITWFIFLSALLVLFLGFFLYDFTRYRLGITNGIAIVFLFVALGCLLTHSRNILNSSDWYGKYYRSGDVVKAVLQESPVEKINSYKVLATITAIADSDKIYPAKGDLIIYFKKDSTFSLDYGSQIIFSNPLQEIKNAGNPSGFDYKRYSLFQDITHQVFLKQGDFIALNKKDKNFFSKILIPVRKKVLSVMRRYITGEKEYGLAEALLIGYKDDLDRNLVQSYTNTGVVHIIAISGMHIALIYWLLTILCRPLRKIKHSKWFVTAIVISGLWLFSLLAGAQASVVRSAVMFTCIAVGENFSRKSSIVNTLAASAFLLLCYNPFWLWDVGFQLSYAAVLSIVIFMKPVYNWFYVKNKILDSVWKLNAVSIAAQLLTTPFSIYHFHQFPVFFLLSNFIAVPLSGIIVLAEIFLCAISIIPFLAVFAGKILSWLIGLMNSYIERIDGLPYSTWGGMQINILQTILLIIIVASFGNWFLGKRKGGVWVGLLGILFFMALRSASFYRAIQQRKIIVYNIAGNRAIDIITGRDYCFIGDPALLTNDFLKNFHLVPSRTLYRVRSTNYLFNLLCGGDFLEYNSKKILMIDSAHSFDTVSYKIPIDLLIISKRPILNLFGLSKTFNIRQVVFDSSVPSSRIKYLINDCDLLHIPYYNVSENGAFVMNLN